MGTPVRAWRRFEAAAEASVAALALALAAGGCADRKRDALREELDEEFEQETGALVTQSEEMSARVNELMRDHELLDARHRELDGALADRELSDADRALQLDHLRRDMDHRQRIDEARRTLKRFQAAVLLHEAMEEGHGTVPLDRIVEEHEQFENDLLSCRVAFDELDQDLDLAKADMERILAEHEEMAARYGVTAAGD